MAKTKPTEGFLVMPTYTAALEEIADTPELVKEIKLAIIDYGSQGEIDLQSLSSFARCYMRLIMENIDRQKETYRKKRDAGAQGGRGNRKQPETTDKADAKQNESTITENQNQNEKQSESSCLPNTTTPTPKSKTNPKPPNKPYSNLWATIVFSYSVESPPTLRRARRPPPTSCTSPSAPSTGTSPTALRSAKVVGFSTNQ